MKTHRTLWLVLGGNLAALLLIYGPYAIRPMQSGMEILVPGLYNLGLLAANFVVSLFVLITPVTRKYAGPWWISFGLLLLFSFPACLATAQISSMVPRH